MQRADELIELFGLERYADNLVSELSTGSRRLVDLAAVVAHQPTVVLLDEPSSGVAQREVEAMVELLRNVRDRLDATLLVVEHDIAFIAELADRLVAMDRGTVLASGAPRAVLGSPEVGEAFLGADPLALSRSGPTTVTSVTITTTDGGPRMSDPDPRPSERPWPRVSRLRVAGPVVLIVAALVAAGVSATAHENHGARAPAATGGGGRDLDPLVRAAHLRRPPPSSARRRTTTGARVRPQDGSAARCRASTPRPACPSSTAATTAAPPRRGDGHHHQRRLLPGPARRPDLGRLQRRGHAGPGARHRPGLRGDVQPHLRAVRASREPHPLQRHRRRHRPGGRPRRRRHRRPAAPRLRLHRRPGPDVGLRGRAGPPARALHGVRRLGHLRRDHSSTRRTSGQTCPRRTPRSSRRSTTSSPS